jgi:hypothetical protein
VLQEIDLCLLGEMCHFCDETKADFGKCPSYTLPASQRQYRTSWLGTSTWHRVRHRPLLYPWALIPSTCPELSLSAMKGFPVQYDTFLLKLWTYRRSQLNSSDFLHTLPTFSYVNWLKSVRTSSGAQLISFWTSNGVKATGICSWPFRHT